PMRYSSSLASSFISTLVPTVCSKSSRGSFSAAGRLVAAALPAATFLTGLTLRDCLLLATALPPRAWYQRSGGSASDPAPAPGLASLHAVADEGAVRLAAGVVDLIVRGVPE